MNIHNLKSDHLLGLVLPLPPLPEQGRIVAEIEKQFTRLDVGFGILQRLKVKLERHEKVVLHSTTQSDNWPVVPFGDLLSERLRNGHSAKASPNGSGVPTITLTAITTGDFLQKNIKTTSANPNRVQGLWLQPNDFLFQRGNTAELVGLSRLFRGPADLAIFPDLVIRARTKDSVNREFIELVLHSPTIRSYLRSRSQGSAGSMPKIDQQAIESAPIPLPPRAVQDRIASEIVAMRTEIQNLRGEIDSALAYAARLRQSILAKAFSGQLVPQDPNDEPASVLLERIRRGRDQNAKRPQRIRTSGPVPVSAQSER